MPRSVDYSKTIIYKLCCKDTNIKDIYIGATTCMKARKALHKTTCNSGKSIQYNNKVYKFIRDNGGWENWDMIMIEKYPCNDKVESCKKEREILEKLGATLNMANPIILKDKKEYFKEYIEQNRDKIREYKKEYREKNKEKIAERSKKYYEKNRKKYKKWCDNNKEKIKEYKKQLYTCISCNTTIRKDGKTKHNKTKKHINNLNK